LENAAFLIQSHPGATGLFATIINSFVLSRMPITKSPLTNVSIGDHWPLGQTRSIGWLRYLLDIRTSSQIWLAALLIRARKNKPSLWRSQPKADIDRPHARGDATFFLLTLAIAFTAHTI
jgi:hypothetical protein